MYFVIHLIKIVSTFIIAMMATVLFSYIPKDITVTQLDIAGRENIIYTSVLNDQYDVAFENDPSVDIVHVRPTLSVITKRVFTTYARTLSLLTVGLYFLFSFIKSLRHYRERQTA